MTKEERRITFAYVEAHTAYRALDHALGMLSVSVTDEKDVVDAVRTACESAKIARDKLWSFVYRSTEQGE